MRLDLRYALRAMAKRPGFALTIILTLGLGIAATSAAFSVVHGVLIEPLPYPQPEQLVSVWEHNVPRARERNSVSPANYLAWRDDGAFARIAAVVASSGSVTSDGEPERVGAITATASFFDVLGARAAVGRLYDESDDRPGAERTTVLSWGFWQRRYGGDPGVVGRNLVLNDVPRRIVGVLDPAFEFDYGATFSYTGTADVFGPPQWGDDARNASGRYLQVVARMRPGSSLAATQQRMSLLADRLAEANPERQAGWRINVVPLREQMVGDVAQALIVIFGAVAFVLLIACANVANLMLTRASERHQEVAVRAALGASRWRIARQHLVESAVLAGLGGATGLLLTVWAVSGLLALAPDIPRLDNIHVDATVLLFTVGTTLFAGLLFGMVPAVQALRSDLATWLRGRVGGGGRRDAKRMRSVLVVTEVALSLVLLIGAGLLIRSFIRLIDAGVGFDTHDLLTATIELPGRRYPDERIAPFFDRLVERLQAEPGIQAVSAITFAPLAGPGSGTSFWANDRPVPEPGELPVADIRWVHRDYHATMGIPLIEGRYFDTSDGPGTSDRIVISEAMKKLLWPDQSAIGKTITMPWDSNHVGEIVGVVRDIRHNGPGDEPRSMIYWLTDQFVAFNQMTLVVRSGSDAGTIATAIRAVVGDLDPDLPVYGVRSMDDRLADAMARTRFAAVSLGAFAVLALVLACIGVYGVMTYVTGQRIQEFGVRMALGAGRGDVVRMVVRQGALLVAIALAIGLVGAIAVTRLLSGLVFDVGTTDPLTFAAMSLVLASVALAACYVPALRAARVDPVTAMRQE
jgi:putative ABC transport system permease protein